MGQNVADPVEKVAKFKFSNSRRIEFGQISAIQLIHFIIFKIKYFYMYSYVLNIWFVKHALIDDILRSQKNDTANFSIVFL